MSDDLIARLLAFEISDEIGNGDFSLMQEAADALVDVQEIKDQLDWTVKENDRLLIEGRELTSRVKQMEEALRGLIELGHPRDPAIIAAKKALGEQENHND